MKPFPSFPRTILTLALATAAWLLPRDARTASPGEAFHRSPLGLAVTALLTADENDAPGLILQGRKLLAAGRTNEAAAKWSAALEVDPRNKLAREFLRQIGRTNLSAATPAGDPPVSKPVARTNLVITSKARQKIYAKLDSIRLETLQFDSVPLQEVIDALSREAKLIDPEQKGVNFLVTRYSPDPQSSPVVDPATGLPLAGVAGGGAGEAVVRVAPPIHEVTLRQALDIITKATEPPQRYSVEDWGVLIGDARTVPAVPLHTRWFKIDTNTFTRNLSASMTMAGSRANGAVISKVAGLELMIEDLRRYFAQAGVDLQPPKSVVFKDLSGILMVRATLQDLDLIEQAVQVLNMIPPQVQVDVKFCEVPEDAMKALGLDWILGSTFVRPPWAATNPPSATPSGLQRRGTVTNDSVSGVRGILTPQQCAVVVKALEQREGVEFLASPRILTTSGRQAQIKTVEVRNIVTGLDLSTNRSPQPGQPPEHPPISEPFELGPVVDVVPYVAADGRTIQMTVIPSIKEFVGYDLDSPSSKDVWDYVESAGSNPNPRRQPYPTPVFRLRQVVTTATVRDGQTIVLSTGTAKVGVPDDHPASKLPQALQDQLTGRVLAKAKLPRKTMLVFITPRITDPAGNAVHPDEELPAR